jgi:hypothetical protein
MHSASPSRGQQQITNAAEWNGIVWGCGAGDFTFTYFLIPDGLSISIHLLPNSSISLPPFISLLFWSFFFTSAITYFYEFCLGVVWWPCSNTKNEFFYWTPPIPFPFRSHGNFKMNEWIDGWINECDGLCSLAPHFFLL